MKISVTRIVELREAAVKVRNFCAEMRQSDVPGARGAEHEAAKLSRLMEELMDIEVSVKTA